MDFFLSAEVDSAVSEALLRAQRKFKQEVIPRLRPEYGSGIKEWAVITILRRKIPEGWGEIKKFHRDSCEVEFRLIIDYEDFKAASAERQLSLYLKSILRSIDLFRLLNIKGFDVEKFRDDIMSAAQSEGWQVL